MDSDIEFSKIKNLLSKNPKILREDPLLGIDYIKIMNLIKRKKLVEDTNNEFDPAQSIDTTYYDIELIRQEKNSKKQSEIDKAKRDIEIQS